MHYMNITVRILILFEQANKFPIYVKVETMISLNSEYQRASFQHGFIHENILTAP